MRPKAEAGRRSDSASVILEQSQVDRLRRLTRASRGRFAEAAGFLEHELARAVVMPDRLVPRDVVTMGGWVTFRDEAGRQRRVKLVFPADESVEEPSLSVLTPVGAALLGLRVGQSIELAALVGRRHRLTILKVEEPGQPSSQS